MITLSIINDFCTWWWLWWILPALLGFLLGWAIWAKYKKRVEELETEVDTLNSTIDERDTELSNWKSKNAELDGQVAIANGRLREKETEYDELNNNFVAQKQSIAQLNKRPVDKEDDYLPTEEYLSHEVTDRENNIAFFTHSNGQHYFVMYNDDGTVKLRSEGFTKLEQRNIEYGGVVSYHDVESRYLKISKGDYFINILYDESGREVGRSPMLAKTAELPTKYSKLKEENLQIIEGIGPKMNEVLNENGIGSWSILASNSESQLRAILDKFGEKYRIIDPSDWATQAKFASEGNWDELIAYQKSDGSDSKAEKVMIKLGILKQWQQDDLKAIEGIGPKIAELLKAQSINTWQDLANTTAGNLEKILSDAGGRYSLAEPATWPKQAALAAAGKFKELEAYQDSLDGGKEVG